MKKHRTVWYALGVLFGKILFFKNNLNFRNYLTSTVKTHQTIHYVFSKQNSWPWKIRMLIIIISILSHKCIIIRVSWQFDSSLVLFWLYWVQGIGCWPKTTNRQESYPDSIQWYIGSAVVECSTRDRGVVGSSLIGVTALCPWARHINLYLILVKLRKTRPDINEKMLTGR